MKDFKKTLFMKEAARGKGHSVLVEMLIAFVLFFISSIAMGIAQIPVLVIYLVNNKDYMSMLMSGKIDSERMLSVMSNMPEWVMIDMLFAEILLTFVVLIYCRFIEKRKLSTLGFVKDGMTKQYLLGIVAGAVVFSVAYLICVITGSVRFEGFAKGITPLYIIGFFFGYVLQGMAEEVLCRGYLMVSLSRRYHVRQAIISSSLFFAVLHASNNGFSLLAFINLFLFGVFASLLILGFGNIWIAGAFHSIWNFVQGNVYGVQVSGTTASSSIFLTSNTVGREIINGGSFGMEGGLAVTFVLVVGILLLLSILYKRGDIIDIPEQQGFAEIAGTALYQQDVYQQNVNQQDSDIVQNDISGEDVNIQNYSSDINNDNNSNDSNVSADLDNYVNDNSMQKTAFDESYFKD